MGVLMLYDREHHELSAVASVGLDRRAVAQLSKIPVSEGPCGLAVSKRRACFVSDLQRQRRFADDRTVAIAKEARAMSCVPLQARTGQIVGAIATYFQTPHQPSLREVQLVELYGGQASEFIENARQYQEIREASR